MKLFLDEPGAAHARRAWLDAPSRTTSVALIAEARAALAAARRARRIDDPLHLEALVTIEALWERLEAIVLTEELALRAGELAEAFALCGYDAIHLATAEAALDEGDVMVVSDTRLAEAAATLGIEALLPAE